MTCSEMVTISTAQENEMQDLIYEDVKIRPPTGKCVKCSKRTQGIYEDEFCCRICKHKLVYKKTVNTLQNLSPFDLGWLVGVVEGEGCFYCKDSKSRLKSGKFVYPMCGFTVMSTDEDVMRRLEVLLDLQAKGPYYKDQEDKRKVVWSIQITGNRAVAIMKTLYEHLSIRRKEQIDKALEWQSRKRFECND